MINEFVAKPMCPTPKRGTRLRLKPENSLQVTSHSVVAVNLSESVYDGINTVYVLIVYS